MQSHVTCTGARSACAALLIAIVQCGEPTSPAPKDPNVVPTIGVVDSSGGDVTSSGSNARSTLVVTVTPQTTSVGGTARAEARWRSASGSDTPARRVTWTSSDIAVAIVDAVGGAVKAVGTGTASILGTVSGVTASATITVSPAPVAVVTVTLGATTLRVGASTAATAVVLDASGSVVTNPDVRWSSTNPGVAAVDSLSGVVTGMGVGDAYVLATCAGVVGHTAVSVTSPAGTSLVVLTEPSSTAQSGVAIPQQPVIGVLDASGTRVSTSGITVTAVIATGGGILGGTTTAVTNAEGVATFTDLEVIGLVGPRTLSFTASGLSSATSAILTLGAGPAAQLAVVEQPSTVAQSGVAFPQQPVLELRDAAGNAVAQNGAPVNVAIDSGGGTLIGTAVATTDGRGVASFTDLGIAGTIGTRTLKFASTSLPGARSNAIAVAAGPPSRLAMTRQPSSSATSGAPFAQQPVVQLRDASDNPVSQAGINVVAAIASGGGLLGGMVAVPTSATGAAAYTNLSISGADGARTLIFTATALTSAQSTPIVVSSAPATGDPKPGLGDVVVLDFRSGGNRDLQSCTTLSCVTSGIGGVFGAVSFTANFDGAGTHALVLPWRKNNGQSSCTGNVGSEQDMFVYIQPNLPAGEIYLQYKIWMGKTATGPGTGTVGSFQNTSTQSGAPGGHKWFVLFRTGNNDARMTAEQGLSWGRFITTPYAGYNGPAPGADGSIGEVHFFGSDVATPWNPDANINQVNTLTFRFKSESAPNAKDGEMSIWVNGILRQAKTGMYTGPYGATEWQVGGPTWICPPQDQTAYIWDMLVWRK